MLTGKFNSDSTFADDDHRNFNRYGESFDVGETFSGVPYEDGLRAVDALEGLKPESMTMAQFALRWILMFDAVTATIPGAKRPGQVEDNVAASEFPNLSDATMAQVAGGVRAVRAGGRASQVVGRVTNSSHHISDFIILSAAIFPRSPTRAR